MRRADLAFLFAFLALAAGTFAIDRIGEPLTPVRQRASGGVVSRGFYCPSPDGVDSTMATANLERHRLRLRRLAIGSGTETASEPGVLAPRRRSAVVVSQLGVPQAAGVAESFGGETVTDLQVSAKDRGLTASKCSARPGERWMFSAASTTRRHDHFLLVANPFQEEAVLRVRVLAPDRDFVPVLLRDRVISALSQEPLLLADFIAETGSFAVDVQATQGRVVVSRYAQIATKDGLRGISLGVGAEGPGRTWLFAGGQVPAEGEESVVLMNPGTSEALVEVSFQTESQTVAPDALKELQVPAGRQLSVKVSDFLPRGTEHSTRVLATNDVPVVAERITVAGVPGGRGYESTMGVSSPGRRWAISAGALPAARESLSIVGAGRSRVPVKVTLITDKGTSSRAMKVRAFPDRRTSLDLEPLLVGGAATLILEAPDNFVVEANAVAGAPFSDLGASLGQKVD